MRAWTPWANAWARGGAARKTRNARAEAISEKVDRLFRLKIAQNRQPHSANCGNEPPEGCGGIVLAPDFLTEGEEICDRGERGHLFGVKPALGDDRYFDHLGPPFENLALRAAAIAERGGPDRAEAHVVRACLARAHPVMARGATEGADDGVLTQFLARGAHRARPVEQVHPVETQTLDHQDMAVDHQRDVAGMGHLAAGIGGACDAVLVAGGKAQPQTGHVMRVDHLNQTVWKRVQFKLGRGDEIDLRLLDLVHLGAPWHFRPS